MRTMTQEVKIYNFEDVKNDVDGIKANVLEKQFDINLDYEWWEYNYEDAKNIGLKITGFDLDRSRHADGVFNLSASEVAANIFRDHGENCETYKTAEEFMEEWQPIFNNYMDESSENYESPYSEDEMIELENDFLNNLLEDYSIMLQNEYEYRYSEEAILETLECNDYEFTEDGEIY